MFYVDYNGNEFSVHVNWGQVEGIEKITMDANPHFCDVRNRFLNRHFKKAILVMRWQYVCAFLPSVALLFLFKILKNLPSLSVKQEKM